MEKTETEAAVNDADSFDIPAELLEQLRQMRGVADEEAGLEINQLDPLTYKVLKKAGGLLFGMFDESMKSKNAPGLGKVNPNSLAELGIIAFEEDLTEKMIKDSPKYAFFLTFGAIITQNGIALARQKSKDEKAAAAAAEREEETNDGNG